MDRVLSLALIDFCVRTLLYHKRFGNKVSNENVTVVFCSFKTMMMLSLSRKSRLEISIWKPSPSFVNFNGSMSILLSDEITEAKWPLSGNVNVYINHEVVPPFYKV